MDSQSESPREEDLRAVLKIGSIVIDCYKFEEMFAFWKGALHYVAREPASSGWVVLKDPSGRGPNISLNQVQHGEKLTGRNWLHFDLYTANQSGEVERLLRLGARRNEQTYEPDDDFIVLRDPDDNLFCVVDKSR